MNAGTATRQQKIVEPAVKPAPIWVVAAVAAALVLGFCFYWVTVPQGHAWSGDHALYLLHAKNIVERHPYSETPFVYNPGFGFHSPRNYPPVFPFLIAPVYAGFGLDYVALKRAAVVFFFASLIPFFYLARRMLGNSRNWALAACLLVAWAPVFFEFRDYVLPDTSYILLSFLTLAFLESVYDKGWNHSRPVLAGVIVGGLCYLSYGCRSVGITLIVAVLAAELWRNRKVTRLAVVTLLSYAAFRVTANALTGFSDDTYYAQLASFLQFLPRNIKEYALVLVYMWHNEFKAVQYVLTLSTLAMAAFGFLGRWRDGLSATDFYVILYVGLMVVWPGSYGTRYLLPVIPLYLLYAVSGLKLLLPRFQPQTTRWAVPALAGLVVICYTTEIAGQLRAHPAVSAIQEPSFQTLCDYVRSKVPPSDIVAFWNPRPLALLTGRKSMVFSMTTDPDSVWRELRSLDARYIILADSDDDRAYLAPAIDKYRAELVPVFQTGNYHVFRVAQP